MVIGGKRVISDFFDVKEFLKGAQFPLTKDEVMTIARHNSADEESLVILDQLPEKEYSDLMDISRTFGEIGE